MLKTKRTYNLSEPVVAAVRELMAQGVARSQDAVVELAISELARKQREAVEAAAWERAASDPIFQREISLIEAQFAAADAETWPPR